MKDKMEQVYCDMAMLDNDGKEFLLQDLVHAYHAYIKLWVHAGSLESTKEA